MPIETQADGGSPRTWTTRLHEAARLAAREMMDGLPQGYGPRFLLGFMEYAAHMATRPRAEGGETSRIDALVTHLRQTFEGEILDPGAPATAAWILEVVRAAVSDELGIAPGQSRGDE